MWASSSDSGLVVRLLDSRRVDPAVGQQLLQRQPRQLTPDAVEPRQDDRARGVVDDEVDAGQVLERADVATLAADDPALEVVGGEMHDRHRRLGRVPGGESLHDDREDVAHAALGLALGLLLDLADPARRVVLAWSSISCSSSSLARAPDIAGEALERALGLDATVGQFGALLIELGLPARDRVLASLQRSAALGQRGLQRGRGGASSGPAAPPAPGPTNACART